ncbi:hydrogenase maturation protease [Marinobacter sp. F4218]|uniref:hydrogenase maturation protease n=1 Tax=Marinobacter sp. F4218 TaxID=2862868 RepID=UPI001C627DFE|nr:hydrogenase maturation protease [Marinobacter sp. F4218]MBW7470826.1 hydrogenase maturation protease [Marinobacter sp. F4218]
MSDASRPIRVIGIGNRDRGDDALGPLVADALVERLPETVDVVEHSGEVAGLVDLMTGARAVYLVDAAVMGLEPGNLRVFDASAVPLPALGGAFSSHALGLSEAIELARALDSLPPVCQVFAVEAASFGAGEGLSPPLEDTLPRVTQAVMDRIRQENEDA